MAAGRTCCGELWQVLFGGVLWFLVFRVDGGVVVVWDAEEVWWGVDGYCGWGYNFWRTDGRGVVLVLGKII